MGFKWKSEVRKENIIIVEIYDGGVKRVKDA
jgi:hypothetical protein